MEVYNREPLYTLRGIPVFTHPDEYTENYSKIATARLNRLDEIGHLEPERMEAECSTIRLIKKYGRVGQKILDVGIGQGRHLDNVPGMNRYGIDISMEYLKEAKGKGIEVAFCKAEEMPYMPGIFDVIVCTDVLEHIFSLGVVLNKILTVLKPGGYLIVRVPYKEDLSPYLSEDFPFAYSHLRTFDEHSLTLLFKVVFKCEIIEHTFATWLPLPYRLRNQRKSVFKDKLYSKSMSIIRKVLPFVYDIVLKKWYFPVEINMVIRSPK